MAFDATYLTKSLCQLRLHERHGLVGGVWEAGSEDQCFVDLEDQAVDARLISKAPSVLHFLCWNPSSPKKIPIAVCSLPVPYSYGGVHSEKRGQWQILEAVGRTLAESHQLVRGIVFDAHGSHALVRRLMHGQLDDICMAEVENIAWFSKLTWRPLPTTSLPRCPIQLCFDGSGEVVYGLPGPCAWSALSVNPKHWTTLINFDCK